MSELLNQTIANGEKLRRVLDLAIDRFAKEEHAGGLDAEVITNVIISVLCNLLGKSARILDSNGCKYTREELAAILTWQSRETIRSFLQMRKPFNAGASKELIERALACDRAWEAVGSQ